MKNKNLNVIRKLKYFIFIFLAVVIVGCTIVVFDDINKYKGSVILRIDVEDVETVKDVHHIYIKKPSGDYDYIRIDRGYGELFSVGDTL